MENSCSSHSRTVEITVLSAEDLRVDGRSVKKKAFAVVKLDPFNNRVTKVDAVGGSYPAWDEKLVMKLPMHVTFITLEVQCRTCSGSGDRLVGRATLPVSDFIGGYVPENHLKFLSYLLRDARGIRSGILNVSVRVKAGSGLGLLKSRYEYCSSSPSAQQKPVIGADEKKFSGLVAGIPVWNPYPV